MLAVVPPLLYLLFFSFSSICMCAVMDYSSSFRFLFLIIPADHYIMPSPLVWVATATVFPAGSRCTLPIANLHLTLVRDIVHYRDTAFIIPNSLAALNSEYTLGWRLSRAMTDVTLHLMRECTAVTILTPVNPMVCLAWEGGGGGGGGGGGYLAC